MKKYFLIIGLAAIFSCSTDPEPTVTPESCSPTSVTLFDEAFTRLIYGPNGSGGQWLTNVTVNDGTDSSYFYNYSYGTNLETISRTEEGETTVFIATFDGDNLINLTTKDGSGNIESDLVFVYNGANVVSAETWIMASDGEIYQFAHAALTYNEDGNLTLDEFNLDIGVLLTIAFGGVPDVAYAPVVLASIEYEYGQEDAPNPIYGSYFMENPDMTFMKNLPISITLKDENGDVIESEAYTITLDDNGYPTKSGSGAKYLEATYVCK